MSKVGEMGKSIRQQGRKTVEKSKESRTGKTRRKFDVMKNDGEFNLQRYSEHLNQLPDLGFMEGE